MYHIVSVAVIFLISLVWFYYLDQLEYQEQNTEQYYLYKNYRKEQQQQNTKNESYFMYYPLLILVTFDAIK
jgi:formate hydrogenlyase subunit 3/multisubunit Na+/H+ antiporter MnhD subunit